MRGIVLSHFLFRDFAVCLFRSSLNDLSALSVLVCARYVVIVVVVVSSSFSSSVFCCSLVGFVRLCVSVFLRGGFAFSTVEVQCVFC